MDKWFGALCLVVSAWISPDFAIAEPDIERYGKTPEYRSFSISPDGRHYAYIQTLNDVDYFVVFDAIAGEIKKSVKSVGREADFIVFMDNSRVLMNAKNRQKTGEFAQNFSGAHVYNLENNRLTFLQGLQETNLRIKIPNRLFRSIVGRHDEKEIAYMPGPGFRHLYKVNLVSGEGSIYAKGGDTTIGWFMKGDGTVLAREVFDKKKNLHKILSRISGRWQTIYKNKVDIPDISFQAIDTDEEGLLFIASRDGRRVVYRLDLHDGEISGPLYSRPNADAEGFETDINRKVTAVRYSGFKTDYDFIDSKDSELFSLVSTHFPNSDIRYQSSTQDKSKAIFSVSGEDAASAYILFDRASMTINKLASRYDMTDISRVKAIKYTARDGLEIPAIITMPMDSARQVDLPLIVLPHDGPDSYDRIGFDWIAQYFAAKGYLVFQPNFRGSTGFGTHLRDSGWGQWGRGMQQDITDGIQALIADGHVDPKRVCIVGIGYGGYAALAGGAYTPDLYQCVISLNGATDLSSLLDSLKGVNSRLTPWLDDHWLRLLSGVGSEQADLKTVSPINSAESFVAPVLLITGANSGRESISQSRAMAKALRKADKEVEFVRLKDTGYELLSSKSRIEALTAIDAFLDKHNPAFNPVLAGQIPQ